jgi:hypothetical protein
MLALTPRGQRLVGRCIRKDADAVMHGIDKMENISLDRCVLSVVHAAR